MRFKTIYTFELFLNYAILYCVMYFDCIFQKIRKEKAVRFNKREGEHN